MNDEKDKTNRVKQDKLSVQGQRDYEEWKAELLSDPDDRAAYEQGVQELLEWHQQQEMQQVERTRKATEQARARTRAKQLTP